VLWDATNAAAEYRRGLLDVAAGDPQLRPAARAVAVLVLPALDVVLARNATRDSTPCPGCGLARRVREDVVRRMHAAIVADLPGLAGEGWDELRDGAAADCLGHRR
jgi:hypothetical protein